MAPSVLTGPNPSLCPFAETSFEAPLTSMNSFAIQALMIDLDGTLIDTLGDFDAVLNHVAHDMKLPPVSRLFIENTVGKGSEHLIRSLLEELGAPDRFDEAWPLYQRHYLAINGTHASLYPGVLEGLQALQKRGLPMACLTNKPLAFAEPLLEKKEVRKFFQYVFGGESFERKKPDPLPLLRTCEALGTPPAATLMIGDSSNDAQAARAAGCPLVLMTYGYNHGQPISLLDADVNLSRLDQLPEFLGENLTEARQHLRRCCFPVRI
jgi:phosphoglycolate phosphatase